MKKPYSPPSAVFYSDRTSDSSSVEPRGHFAGILTAIHSLGSKGRYAMVSMIGVMMFSMPSEGVIPYGSGFEASEGYFEGTLNAQNGWAIDEGQADVTNAEAASGSRSVLLHPSDPRARIHRDFNQFTLSEIVFIEFRIRGGAGLPPQNAPEASSPDVFFIALVNEDGLGRIYVLDGDGQMGGVWQPTARVVELDGHGGSVDWVPLTLRVDFQRKTFDVYQDGQLVGYDYGFFNNNQTHFSRFVLSGNPEMSIYLDDLYIGERPSGWSNQSGDGIDDAWKAHHGFDLSSDIRSLDSDGDGLSNLEEYFLGTDPTSSDSSRDGLTDGVAVDRGVNPLVPSNRFPVALPFSDDFEEWPPGGIDARGGWQVTGEGAAQVSAEWALSGTQGLLVDATGGGTKLHVEIEENAESIVWTDVLVKPVPHTHSSPPAVTDDALCLLYFDGDGNAVAWDGLSNSWKSFSPPIPSGGLSYIRVTVRQDFIAQTWGLWLNGVKVSEDLGFARPGASYSRFAVVQPAGGHGAVDDVGISVTEPLGLDDDGDGLPNQLEIALGTDPANPDTSGDGMWDGNKVLWGFDPIVTDDFARSGNLGNGRFGWETDFEGSEGFLPGSFHGQQGWRASPASEVTTTLSFAGDQAVAIPSVAAPDGVPVFVERFFGLENEKTVWVTSYVKVQSGQLPDVSTISDPRAALIAFNPRGYLFAWDGNEDRWIASGRAFEGSEWLRIDVGLNYREQSWKVCVDGILVLRGLGFKDQGLRTLTRFGVTGATGGEGANSFLDSVRVELQEPQGLDFSGDGMSNDEKRALGLDIYRSDTTGDGLPDWWLVAQGVNPLDPTIGSQDLDGDGLTVREEFLLGTNPTDPDTDGDGWTDMQEILALTDPFEAADAPDVGLEPWQETGINERRPGGAFRVGEEYRLAANARDLTGTSDGFRFLHQEVTGDFSFSAQVKALENVFPWDNLIDWTARAGLMARETLDANSRYAVMSMTPRGGFFFRGRQNLDQVSTFDIRNNWTSPFPSWIKIKRRGNLFSGYRSYDGENWVTVGSWTMNLPETLYLGMMVSSGHSSQFARARFGDVQLSLDGDDPGYWEEPDLDLPLYEIAAYSGSSFTGFTGRWEQAGDSVHSREIRGSLRYPLELIDAGPYVLEVEGRQANPRATNDRFSLVIRVNGVEVGRPILHAPLGGPGITRVFLPFLPAGQHELEIEWRNGLPQTFLQIDAIRLLAVDDADTNGSGRPDWLDARLAVISHVDDASVESLTSPFGLEGRSFYPEMLGIWGFAAPGVPVEPATVQAGLRGYFFTNVPLDPSAPTEITVSEQNGAATYAKTVTWTALNVLDVQEEEFTVRRGDAMRFTATKANLQSANPNHSITVSVAPLDDLSDVQTFVSTANLPIILVFEEDGDYLVSAQAANSSSPEKNGHVVVNVRGIDFGAPPAAVIGHSRNWLLPHAAEEAYLEWDNHLFLQEVTVEGTIRQYLLAIREDRPGTVLARLGNAGPVLGKVSVQPIRNDSHAYTSMRVIERFADGSSLVEHVIVLGDIPADLNILLVIFRAGVLFDDGTLERIVTADDFDEYGRYRYRMLQSAETIGAACHTRAFYQDGEPITLR